MNLLQLLEDRPSEQDPRSQINFVGIRVPFSPVGSALII
jgi:hypothetical protein